MRNSRRSLLTYSAAAATLYDDDNSKSKEDEKIELAEEQWKDENTEEAMPWKKALVEDDRDEI